MTAREHSTIRCYRDSDMEQGTHEWRAWRRSVIGASDAPTIMRQNPWNSPERLFEEKLGRRPEFAGNAATREGQALEPHARAAITEQTGITLLPAIAQSVHHPFLAASLDAIDATSQHLFEIKAGVRAYEHCETTGTMPEYYTAQLQHQMMVAGLDHMHYVAFRPERPLIIVKVWRDEAFLRRLLAAELRFVEMLRDEGHVLQSSHRGVPIT